MISIPLKCFAEQGFTPVYELCMLLKWHLHLSTSASPLLKCGYGYLSASKFCYDTQFISVQKQEHLLINPDHPRKTNIGGLDACLNLLPIIMSRINNDINYHNKPVIFIH